MKKMALWIDLCDPDRAELEHNLRATPHPRALEQLLAPKLHTDDPRPTLESHGDYIFGVLLVPRLDTSDGEVGYQEVDLVLAPDEIVTVRKTCARHGAFDCSHVRAAHESGRAVSVGAVAHMIVDDVAEGFLELADRLAERIDTLEDNVEEWTGQRVREEISALRHEMLHIRQVLAPTRDALRRVVDDRVDVRTEGDGELFDRDTELHFADVYDKLLRATEGLDLARDLLASVRDYHQAKVANDQNEVMKRLTVIASLLLLPSFIVGLYGVNLHGAPEYHWRWGYGWVWALIIVTTMGQLWYFRRKRWL